MEEKQDNYVWPTVEEPVVQFKSISDKKILCIQAADSDEELIRISGYDLQMDFNMEHLKTLEDIEAATKGIADLFKSVIIENLLQHQKQSE